MTRSDESLPVVDADGLPDAASGSVAGILLAAGTSERFGDRNKLVATVDGDPVVRRAARTLVESRADPVLAVLGHEADRVRAALSDLPVETVVTGSYDRGLSASVRAGVGAVREHAPDAAAAVFALGDMPDVAPATVDALVAAHAAGVGTALAAAHGEHRGNPVLFDRRHFDALAALEGDVGGREVLRGADEAALVAVDDPGVLRDVDRPEDLPERG